MALLLTPDTAEARLTKQTLAAVKRSSARNGFHVDKVSTRDEAQDALIKALPQDISEDMLNFIDENLRHKN